MRKLFSRRLNTIYLTFLRHFAQGVAFGFIIPVMSDTLGTERATSAMAVGVVIYFLLYALSRLLLRNVKPSLDIVVLGVGGVGSLVIFLGGNNPLALIGIVIFSCGSRLWQNMNEERYIVDRENGIGRNKAWAAVASLAGMTIGASIYATSYAHFLFLLSAASFTAASLIMVFERKEGGDLLEPNASLNFSWGSALDQPDLLIFVGIILTCSALRVFEITFFKVVAQSNANTLTRVSLPFVLLIPELIFFSFMQGKSNIISKKFLLSIGSIILVIRFIIATIAPANQSLLLLGQLFMAAGYVLWYLGSFAFFKAGRTSEHGTSLYSAFMLGSIFISEALILPIAGRLQAQISHDIFMVCSVAAASAGVLMVICGQILSFVRRLGTTQ